MHHRGILAIIEGDWLRAGVEPPRLYPWDRVRIAERAYRDAAWGDRPATVAAACGVRLVPTRATGVQACGGEITVGDVVLFCWSGRTDERHLRQWHGLAHALLARERWDHTEADAWLLTLELACPHGSDPAAAHLDAGLAAAWSATSARLGRSSAA